MNISIIGLGKLGYPMAEFLSSSGETINCYDADHELISILKDGKNPLVYENQLQRYRENGNKLNFYYDLEECLKYSDIVFITVPTPSLDDGFFDNSIVIEVLNEIAKFQKRTKKKIDIVINSTVSPGSFDEIFIPFMKKNGLENHKDYSLIYNPYFVALGNVLQGLTNPDHILIGTDSIASLSKIKKIYNKTYENAQFSILNYKEAELAKLLTNTFLTLKISFTNLVGDLTKHSKNLNSSKILNAIGRDSRIGNKFLKVGGPFSGPCLPRDNDALVNFTNKLSVKNYISSAVVDTNQNTIENLKKDLQAIKEKGFEKLGFAGIGYKPNTSGLEESYVLKLIEEAKKINLKIFIFDNYLKNIKFNFKIEFKRLNSLRSLSEKSDIVFLPYVDSAFNILNNSRDNLLIWDIWEQLDTKMSFSKIVDLENIYKPKNNLVVLKK